MHVSFDQEPLVITVFFSGIAMLVPAAAGMVADESGIARAFLFSGLGLAVLAIFVGIALANRNPSSTFQSKLLRLLAIIVCLPLLLSVPLFMCMPSVPALDLYFEMVSCLTTTGATIFPEGERLSGAVHLWRGIVAWVGGFIMLATAIALIMPAKATGSGQSAPARSGRNAAYSASRNRTTRTARLFLAYSGATLLLWGGLTALGENPLDSWIHAMSTISTSGVSAQGQLAMPGSTAGADMLVALFLFTAATGLFFAAATSSSFARVTIRSAEFWLALAVVGLACVVVLPQQISILDSVSGFQVAAEFFDALLGTVFTVFSFMTTTGFQSSFWIEPTGGPRENHVGIVLTALALIGGSVVSTAGGIKLLRILALTELGAAEIKKMLHPSSAWPVSGLSGLRKEELIACGALFMLFVLSTVLVMLFLAVAGEEFEPALVIAVSVVSSTGPLAETVLGNEFSFGEFSTGMKLTLAGAMIVGRLELVALIAILSSALRRM